MQMKRINILPDEVLLEIFDFYVIMNLLYGHKAEIQAWQLLVHVCRRWRNVVYASPRRLNLRLVCTPGTPARTLDIWPPLALVVRGFMGSESLGGRVCADNIIAALGKNNRVHEIYLWHLAGRQLENVLAAMQVPFPELTDLQLSISPTRETTSAIPDSFLDGSAPRLRHFFLHRILFPAMPKLLLSTIHLESLSLSRISHSTHTSPKAMVAIISVLSNLRTLSLQFEYAHSLPDWGSRSLPPPKHSILPALNYFRFKGFNEYLEDLVTFIDAPQLDEMYVAFFYIRDQIGHNCPRLAQFIDRAPKLSKRDEARVEFDVADICVRFAGFGTLQILISCTDRDREASAIAQVCNSSLPSTVENLYIMKASRLSWWNILIEDALWLRLLLPFTAVKNLYLCEGFAPDIAAAMKELTGARMTEVLPSLRNIFVERLAELSEAFQESIVDFVSTRQRLSGHPMAISDWEES